jgi:16S rRNA (guanine(1405)-N(7))-methyltransferase
MSEDDIRGLAAAAVAADCSLAEYVTRGMPVRRVLRTRAYRDVAAAVRHQVYAVLRRYKPDTAALEDAIDALAGLAPATPATTVRAACVRIAGLHASTRERLSDLDAFHSWLLPVVRGWRRVVDLGCGVYPLVFPFAEVGPRLEQYVAVDRDAAAERAVTTFATLAVPGRLRFAHADLGDPEALAAVVGPDQEWDGVLMLKLVPALARQSTRRADAVLDGLAAVRARTWVVSGSVQALTRYGSIRRRESATLRRFLDRAGCRVTDEFVSTTEVVLMAEREARPGGA